MDNKSLDNVKDFWENNPLFIGEAKNEKGTKKFFEEHTQVYISDCFAGEFDQKTVPNNLKDKTVLDLGCGIGFWVVQLSKSNPNKIIAADLTNSALNLTKKRCNILGLNNVEFINANAEELPFKDSTFDHINCQGVIHHTPNTDRAIKEISRVLKPGGTFSISVYYRNFILRSWPFISPLGKILSKFGGGLKGRGREKIFSTKDINEIVRLYDGGDNPIGKSYSRKSFQALFDNQKNLIIDDTFLHFFPARSLPFYIPGTVHKYLDKRLGFMIYKNGRKKMDDFNN